MTSLEDSDQSPRSYPAEKCYEYWVQAEDIVRKGTLIPREAGEDRRRGTEDLVGH